MKEIIIGMLLFTAVLVGISSFYSDLASNYGITTTNISSIAQTQNINNMLNTTYNSATNTSTPLSKLPYVGTITDSFFSFFNAAWNGIFLILGIPLLAFNMITDSGTIFAMSGFNIPQWFIMLLMGLMLVSIIFFVLKFLRQGSVD